MSAATETDQLLAALLDGNIAPDRRERLDSKCADNPDLAELVDGYDSDIVVIGRLTEALGQPDSANRLLVVSGRRARERRKRRQRLRFAAALTGGFLLGAAVVQLLF